jgi:hypothetical protein
VGAGLKAKLALDVGNRFSWHLGCGEVRGGALYLYPQIFFVRCTSPVD